MKKIISAILALSMSAAMITSVMADDDITVTVNGNKLYFEDTAPFIENERTLVPMRAIFEALGADVDWDGESRTVYACDDETSTEIILPIDSDTMIVNNGVVRLEVSAKIVGASTVIPLRAVAESMNCDVDWNGDTRTVTINRKKDSSYQYLIDKYNGDYIDVSGRSVGQVAEETGVTYDEFLSMYGLPADMPPEVSESAAYNMIPFGVIIEMNGFTGMETVESAKQVLELPDWITYDTPWGEAIGQATLGAYVGEDYLEQFKAYYNLDDSVNGDTLYRDVKYQVDLQDRNKRIESENSQ